MNARPCARAAASMRDAGVGLAVANRRREVRLRERRARQPAQFAAARCPPVQQVHEQVLAAGFRLPRARRAPCFFARSASVRILQRIAGAQDAAPALRRAHSMHDDVAAGHAFAHQRHVVLADAASSQCIAATRRRAVGEALEPGAAAAGEDREPAARFAHRPFEQRIVAAGDDRRRRLARPLGGAAAFAASHASTCARGKQQLARRAHVRQRVAAHEIVDAAFLEAQVRGDLARVHHGGRGRRRAWGLLRGTPRFCRDRAICRRGSIRATAGARRRQARATMSTAGTTYDSASCTSGIASPRNACRSSVYWPGHRHQHEPRRLLCCRNSCTTGTMRHHEHQHATRWPALPCTCGRAAAHVQQDRRHQQRSAAAARRGSAPNSRAPNRNGMPTAGSGANAQRQVEAGQRQQHDERVERRRRRATCRRRARAGARVSSAAARATAARARRPWCRAPPPCRPSPTRTGRRTRRGTARARPTAAVWRGRCPRRRADRRRRARCRAAAAAAAPHRRLYARSSASASPIDGCARSRERS